MDIPDPLLPGQYVIYALVDPTDGLVYYVGQTRNAHRRLAHHLAARYHDGEKGDWLRRLKQKGQQPLMHILEVVRGEGAALQKEREWIRSFLERKMPLFNGEVQPRRNKPRPSSTPVAEICYIHTSIAGAPRIVAVRLPDGRLGATLRSLCKVLNLDQVAQLRRVRHSRLLAKALHEATISTPGGPQRVGVLLNWALAMWAAGLQVTELPETKRAAALVLQSEAFTAIEQAFTQGGKRAPDGG
jgi:predicted GIY-YIG superfamily endonuclease